MKQSSHTTLPLINKNLIHYQPAFFEQVGKIISEKHAFETEKSFESQFGFFEWNTQEDKITLCSYLSEILAFENNNSRQSYAAWLALTHPDDMPQINLVLDKIQIKLPAASGRGMI